MNVFFKYSAYSIVLGLLVGGIALNFYPPILKQIPKPSGPHSVGIISLDLVDQHRAESHSKDAKAKRELLVDVYYPSSAEKGIKYPYQPLTMNALKKSKATHSQLPAWVWTSLLDGVYSYAAPQAPVQEGTYPLILFLPGIGSAPVYSSYLEELASHGYVVACVYPSYDSEVVGFPDGRVIELDPDLRDMVEKNDRKRIYAYRALAHQVWLQDLVFVLDTLTKLNADAAWPLHNKLDLNRVGAMGHSHGGAVVIDFCRRDKRCKAGVNLDGWTKTESTAAVPKPFLTLVAGTYDFSKPLTGGATGFDTFVKNMESNKDSSIIFFKDADHVDFSDMIFAKWPVGKLCGDPYAVRMKIMEHITKFFDKYLKT